MGRTKQNPVERFSDILPLWQAAEIKGGVVFTAPSDNAAVNLVYRLNQYRKIMRQNSDYDHTSLDSYVVRRDGATIEIAPRPTFDLSTMRTLDGKPIDSLIPPPQPSRFSYDPATPDKIPDSKEQIEIDRARADVMKQGFKLE